MYARKWMGIYLVLGALFAFAPPASAEPMVNIVAPGVGVYQIPADGNTVETVRVRVVSPGAKTYKLAVKSTPPDRLTVLNPEIYTPGDEVAILVRAGRTPGRATLEIASGDAAEKTLVPSRIDFDLTKPELPVPPAQAPDVPGLIGGLATFLLFMLLLSIVAEKATDLLKQLWEVVWGRPKPTLEELLGPSTIPTLLTYTEKNLRVLQVLLQTEPEEHHSPLADASALPAETSPAALPAATPAAATPVIGAPVPPTTPPPATAASTGASPDDPELQRWREIERVNRQRERNRSQWVWQWRLVAAGVGWGLAAACKIDSIDLLRPLVGNGFLVTSVPGDAQALKNLGIALTGFGASLGASFWHDFLDRIARLKGSTSAPASLPGTAPKPGGLV